MEKFCDFNFDYFHDQISDYFLSLRSANTNITLYTIYNSMLTW